MKLQNTKLHRIAPLLTALLLFAVPAFAGPHWFVREVRWMYCNANANGVWCRDSLYTEGGTGPIDTTEWVQLDKLFIPPLSQTIAADSIVVGYFIVQSDSSATYTASLTAVTAAIDIGCYTCSQAGGNTASTITNAMGAQISTAGSQLITSGVKMAIVPILTGALTSNPINSIRSGVAAMQFLPLRLRFGTASTGAQGLGGARCFVAYMKDE